MPRRVIRPEQFGAALTDVLERRRAQAEVAALDAAHRAVRYAVELTDTEEIVDQGTYRRGFQARKIAGGAEYGNDAPHAGVVEHGRRPGAPGPSAKHLEGWVRRKLTVKPSEARRVAFLVARAIHERGLPPKAIMRRTWARVPDFFREALRKRLK
ncbi:MAG TPA: hypothetical protein VEB22_15485 [Phycisphaerales bacterium]|nr:hypothetical protein [Phycisphaerales bacterium]